jgi:hypothetical protein
MLIYIYEKIMASNTPIYSIAKDLNIDSNRILLACKSIGINAKGATKRLNKEELEKVKNYFETGKNVSEEIVEINQKKTSIKSKTKQSKRETKISYFPNRLIAKS